MYTVLTIATDWWSVGATIISGIITAIATMGAVIYTHHCTQKQLQEQELKHEQVRIEQYKQSKYVVIKPRLLLNCFVNILDKIIIQNNYERVLLFSGDDGFEFFDDENKRATQRSRLLFLENTTENDIKDVVLKTETILLNMQTEEKYSYSTCNVSNLIRSKESMIIRLTNQTQYNKILEMSNNNISSLLDFICEIEYTTLADQRVKYIYQIRITNDNRIEIIKDNVESVTDIKESLNLEQTIFRNIQDYISGIDRFTYAGIKMGQAQMQGILTQFPMQQNIEDEKPKDN